MFENVEYLKISEAFRLVRSDFHEQYFQFLLRGLFFKITLSSLKLQFFKTLIF